MGNTEGELKLILPDITAHPYQYMYKSQEKECYDPIPNSYGLMYMQPQYAKNYVKREVLGQRTKGLNAYFQQ